MQSKEGAAPPRGLGELWGISGRGARGPKARHSTRDVATAAVRLADRSGLESVTLGAVAAELGLTTTALYRYVDAKEDLLELMLDAAFGAPPTLGGPTWQERARAWALALADCYRRHPWLGLVRVTGVPRRPSLYAWTDALVGSLDDAPAGLDRMRLALLLDAVVRGLAVVGGGDEPPPLWLAEAIGRRHPRLAAELARDWSDTEDELRAAVDVVLRGVAAQEPAQAAP